MRLLRSAVCLALVLAADCRKAPRQMTRSPVEQSAYSVLLDSMFADTTRQFVVSAVDVPPRLWLADATANRPLHDSTAIRQELERRGFEGDVVADFIAANRPAEKGKQLAADFRGWELRSGSKGDHRFHRVIRNGEPFVAFAHMGLSQDHQMALVYAQTYCGVGCSSAYLVSLRLERGRWHIARYETLWTV